MTARKGQAGGEGQPSMLVQLSDLHWRPGQGREDPAERVSQAVASVAALQPQPSAVLLSGDLVDEPSSDGYERVHELLQPLGLPMHAIPGNHDDRDMLRARFDPRPAPGGAPVRCVFTCGALRVVGCDSTTPGSESGALGEEELAWLEQTLAEDPGSPTLVALHHPPVLTGVRSIDAIGLRAEDRSALESLLAGYPQVQAITCGHTHLAAVSAFAGRPLLLCPSTSSALCLDLRAREDPPFAFAAQPVGFAVHALVDGRLVSHVRPLERAADR